MIMHGFMLERARGLGDGTLMLGKSYCALLQGVGENVACLLCRSMLNMGRTVIKSVCARKIMIERKMTSIDSIPYCQMRQGSGDQLDGNWGLSRTNIIRKKQREIDANYKRQDDLEEMKLQCAQSSRMKPIQRDQDVIGGNLAKPVLLYLIRWKIKVTKKRGVKKVSGTKGIKGWQSLAYDGNCQNQCIQKGQNNSRHAARTPLVKKQRLLDNQAVFTPFQIESWSKNSRQNKVGL